MKPNSTKCYAKNVFCFLAKKISIASFILLSFQSVNAAVSNYTFVSTAGTYTSLTGATTFISSTWDNGTSALLTMPFTFTYNGANFTTLSINANGFITLGALSSNVYCGLQTSAFNSIAGYGTDLVGASQNSSITYGSRGASPNRQFVVQWKDCDHYANYTPNHWTFQIILNETSNTVQVVWGSNTATTTMGSNSCYDIPSESGNVGLLGSLYSDFNIRSITNGVNTWSTSSAGGVLGAVCNMAPTNFPVSGTTFTWTPGVPAPMSYTSCSLSFLNNSLGVQQGTTSDQILQIRIVTAGPISPLNLNSITFSTAGCTNALADLANAKVYFTNTSNTFSPATQFGISSLDPNGFFTVSGTATLSEGTNYFWLTYDIKPNAIYGDVISACCTEVNGSGTMGARIPSVTCPAGVHNVVNIGTWTPISTPAPATNSGVMLVLSDGSVLCKTGNGGSGYGNTWNKLTPDIHGSYVNGTWTTIAPMYNTRLYFSSQILKDGRVYVAGGEYGTGLAQGEIYDPLTDVWTMTPSPGASVSDANSAILDDGRVLQALVAGTLRTNVIYDPSTNTFTAGPTCLGIHNESSWLKLKDNSILFIDRLNTSSERYIPATNTWVADATVPASLYDPYGLEFGTALLLPDERAFYVGSTGKTAFYTPSGNSSPGSWTLGPDIPNAQGQPDAPGAMMVNGKILLTVSPIPTSANHFPMPTAFYEFDYLTNTYSLVNSPEGTTSINISCFTTNLTDLPDGKVLYSRQGSNQYYVYTPTGTALSAGKPTIANVIQNGCRAYTITGTKFNGISEGACYGDDWQMATNFPIIRLSSGSDVYYVRTANWNSTGVMRGSLPDTTQFTIPSTVPAGTYSLVVTANGIASDPISFVVNDPASLSSSLNPSPICTGSIFSYTPTSTVAGSTFTWTRAAVAGISNVAITTPQSSNPNEVLVNITSNPISVVYLYSTTANGCAANVQSVTVVVNPNLPAISNSGIASTQCIGASLNIPFTVNCNYNPGNTFTAQLSNSTGSFSSPTNIGTLSSIGSGTISAILPAGLSSGSAYRIRIISSSPAFVGNNNGTDISITGCTFAFNVKLFIQGFYSGGGTMRAAIDPILHPTVCDSVVIELHNSTSPFSLVDVASSTINLSGMGIFSFAASSQGQLYYIVVKHRNALETWSAAPVLLTSGGSYDFSTASNKAFGSNQISVESGVYALWSGDVSNGIAAGVQDGIINVSDFNMIQSALTSFISGYNYCDLSGDGVIESGDYSLIENNTVAGVIVSKP